MLSTSGGGGKGSREDPLPGGSSFSIRRKKKKKGGLRARCAADRKKRWATRSSFKHQKERKGCLPSSRARPTSPRPKGKKGGDEEGEDNIEIAFREGDESLSPQSVIKKEKTTRVVEGTRQGVGSVKIGKEKKGKRGSRDAFGWAKAPASC